MRALVQVMTDCNSDGIVGTTNVLDTNEEARELMEYLITRDVEGSGAAVAQLYDADGLELWLTLGGEGSKTNLYKLVHEEVALEKESGMLAGIMYTNPFNTDQDDSPSEE